MTPLCPCDGPCRLLAARGSPPAPRSQIRQGWPWRPGPGCGGCVVYAPQGLDMASNSSRQKGAAKYEWVGTTGRFVGGDVGVLVVKGGSDLDGVFGLWLSPKGALRGASASGARCFDPLACVERWGEKLSWQRYHRLLTGNLLVRSGGWRHADGEPSGLLDGWIPVHTSRGRRDAAVL